MSIATLLLPALHELQGELATHAPLARVLARADAGPPADAGRLAQLFRHFDVLPRHIPQAPLARLLDADDAVLNGWMRCDPAHVRADGSLLRLMGWGEQLQPQAEEVAELLADLRPLFGDFDAPLSAPHPARWYAAVAHPEALPAMSSPVEASGEDVLAHLPQGRAGARWRQLWNESQVLLHQHPVNRRRGERGLPAINSLWFWGGGRLPDSVRGNHAQVVSDDPAVSALTRLAHATSVGADVADWSQDLLLDLRKLRSLADLQTHVLPELQQRLRSGECQRIVLDFADGAAFVIEHRQRMRWWRRRLPTWPVRA